MTIKQHYIVDFGVPFWLYLQPEAYLR